MKFWNSGNGKKNKSNADGTVDSITNDGQAEDSPNRYRSFEDSVPSWFNKASAGGEFYRNEQRSKAPGYNSDSTGNKAVASKKKQHERDDSASTFSQSSDFRSLFDDSKHAPLNAKGDPAEEEIYIVKQQYGYFSVIFSVGQVAALALMMLQCGVAPFNINPMIGPYPDALSEWGGKNAYDILEEDEWYRLITPIMLHAGIIHLLCNVAVQLETGAFFEREWGSATWLIIYLTSAVGSSVLSVVAMPDAISVGSSGAVMGLFGGKLAEIICRMCESDKTEQGRIGHQVRKEQCAGVTCSVVVVLLFSFIPYVDWAAHLGGLLAGIVVGIMVFSLSIKTLAWRCIWFVFGTMVSIIFFGVSFLRMYTGDIHVADELHDVCGYYKENFDNYECNCQREQ